MNWTDEEILLGAAMMLLKRHGAVAPAKVAERIGDLASEGDWAGVATWKLIARRMDEIMKAGTVH